MIYLLRAPAPPDPYEQALRAAGFPVRSLPVLQFRFAGQRRLRERIARPRTYGGLIVTSPRTVQALEGALTGGTARAWQVKPVYAVGPRTAGMLRDLGFHPWGEECGSASALAGRICSDSTQRPLLFPCSDRRRDTLPRRLAEAGVPFEEVTAYETRAREPIDFTGRPEASWVVFFSPSGVASTRGAPGIDWETVRKAAIGPTTAEAVAEAYGRVDAVAEEPTSEAVAAAICSACGRGAPPACTISPLESR